MHCCGLQYVLLNYLMPNAQHVHNLIHLPITQKVNFKENKSQCLHERHNFTSRDSYLTSPQHILHIGIMWCSICLCHNQFSLECITLSNLVVKMNINFGQDVETNQYSYYQCEPRCLYPSSSPQLNSLYNMMTCHLSACSICTVQINITIMLH